MYMSKMNKERERDGNIVCVCDNTSICEVCGFLVMVQ